MKKRFLFFILLFFSFVISCGSTQDKFNWDDIYQETKVVRIYDITSSDYIPFSWSCSSGNSYSFGKDSFTEKKLAKLVLEREVQKMEKGGYYGHYECLVKIKTIHKVKYKGYEVNCSFIGK